MQHIGEIIINLRETMGLRQAELSRRLQIPQATLSGYEQGHREVGAEWLLRMAEFFDVSVDYLLGATKFRKGIRFLDDVFLDAGSERIKNRDFFDIVDKLTPEWKGIITNMAEMLLRQESIVG